MARQIHEINISIIFMVLMLQYSSAGKTAQFVQKVGGFVLDLFGLGSDVFGIFSDTNNELEQKITEVSQKIDSVLTNLQILQSKMVDLFAQQDLKARLAKVEDFQRSTSNRVRDLKNIAIAPVNERDKYMNIFVKGVEVYLDNLYNIIPYITEPTLSSTVTLLNTIGDLNRCDMTYLSSFVNFSRSLICSGIAVEATYKLKTLNVSLTTEKDYWVLELKKFDDAVTKMYGECGDKFYSYYSLDILMNKSFPEMLDSLEHRYLGMSFFGVNISDSNEMQISSNLPERQFTCIREKCETRKCFVFTKKEASCSANVKLVITMKDFAGNYFLSSDWPGTLIPLRDLSGSTLTLAPLQCITLGHKYELQKPTANQFHGGETCAAATKTVWQPLLLAVVAKLCVYINV
ncbi:uncharacterized protein LOC127843784 [Dreissena polymorpha]|uniref:Uncharacterized protein n=1 Tax=Dreissena polymorpha TaxID=45954 RepID=A0A9D4EIY2_DREPO|nr:uncharacterized protein LOC127843784 [Dreissena polymorpha]KAH3778920.1 hypothetical protein DPMN_180397 [Dreissena polymorpha]